MMRYASLQWPWVGFLVALALVAQEALMHYFKGAPALDEAV